MTAEPLTAQHIKALKHADSVCFDYNETQSISRIRINKDGDNTPDGFDQTIMVNCSLITRSYAGAFKYACAVETCPQSNSEWCTIVSLLKPGDELILEWIAGDSNGYMQHAGLFNDILKLRIRRNNEHKYSFRVMETVCPDNSARMCKAYAW